MATKRPRSDRYSARSNPQRYLLDAIPPTLWARVRAQAKREHVSLRTLILTLLEAWLAHADVRARLAEAGDRNVADEQADQPDDHDEHHDDA